MKVAYALIVGAVVAALAWGFISSAGPPGVRPAQDYLIVDAAWYETLPRDPAAATEAYVARVPSEVHARASAVRNGRLAALLAEIAVLTAAIALTLYSGTAARMRALAERVSSRVWVVDALVGLQTLLVLFLAALPVQTYARYVRLRAAGIVDVPFIDWLADHALGWVIDSVFFVVAIVAIMALIRRSPRSWPAWAAVVYVVVYGAYVAARLTLIAPLFYELTPLADGPHRDVIVSLARANGVPTDQVYVRHTQSKTPFPNADVAGFGDTARIVLDDTTLTAPMREVRLVMAHEIGHWVLHHEFKSLVMRGVLMALGFIAIAWAMRRLLARFGARWRIFSAGDSAAVPLLWFLFLVWGYLALPASHAITRNEEFEADLFGLNASREPFGLADFLLRGSDVRPAQGGPMDWLLYTHPDARDRIFAAMRWRAENPGKYQRCSIASVPVRDPPRDSALMLTPAPRANAGVPSRCGVAFPEGDAQ